MNVVLVGPVWFPRGSAASSRLRHLALGLRDRGADVHVVSMAPRPVAPGDPASPEVSLHEGVTYECVSPFTAAALSWHDPERSRPRLRRSLRDRARWFAGLYASTPAACRRLRALVRGGACDLVFVYDRSALRLLPLARTGLSLGVPTVLDVTEVSEHLSGRANPLYWDFAAGGRISPRLFRAHTVITTGLQALYRARGAGRALVVPALESWPPKPPPAPTGRREFRLVYVGTLPPRDAPDRLFETVRLLAAREPGVALHLIGGYDGTDRGDHFRRRCAEDVSLRDRVRFLGALGDAELRAHLEAADGLLLTRRDARPEVLSFPTRLVEHLRVGRPVFVSAVGDVPLYLRDGVDAVLLDPADPGRAAGALSAVVRRVDRGAAIGIAGRKAGARSFDRETHAARLLELAAELREAA